MENVLVGINAGLNITTEKGLVIIGDNVKDLIQPQDGVIFLGNNVAIGKTLGGKRIIMGGMGNIQEKEFTEFVEKFKRNFSGSDDYISGINDAAYMMARELFPNVISDKKQIK